MKVTAQARRNRKTLALSAPDAFNSIAQIAHHLEDVEHILAFLTGDVGAQLDAFRTELTIEGHSFAVELPRAQVLRELNNIALAGRGRIIELLRAAG